ncbi:hypothetical protein HNR12_005356 [Streptomonospora nanhaiensis]|uniref:Uncharacterized protein n=1 Tax=Streptomonospora nanhaiensis TaxID=1323731 RepID=A0A853BTF3_9ACTN|nr:hypothetical protein [Streptomonospora nanhaiensis]NYI99079.1 hypothetical protein [Streptomonospora nanhaiensis]
MASSAGHTSRVRRQPARTATSSAGTTSDSSGSWRPAMAENSSVAVSGSVSIRGPATVPSTISGLPRPPKATGAVLASSASTTALIGWKPRAAIMAAVMAIGEPPPATPSSSAPNPKAMSSAWSRRSGLKPESARRMLSKRPVATVTLWK